MPFVAALPRSPLHVDFLRANAPDVDLVLHRDAHLAAMIEESFPGRSLALGRERRPSRNPLRLAATFRANRDYYRRVGRMLDELPIERMILFLEGEPLERFISDRLKGRAIELWEDGLSHYVDLTHPAWYAARGGVQALAGFYPRAIWRRRADRGRFTVRDRFDRRNLILSAPRLAPAKDRVLMIGSPLVEDGIVSRARWSSGMVSVRDAIGSYHYLPHPRESDEAIHAATAIRGIAIAERPFGLFNHLAQHGYLGFLSAASTALLDIQALDRSAFLAELFGLTRMARALHRWDANPVATIATTSELKELVGSWRKAANASPAG